MRRWGWRWMAFFLLQAPLLLAESRARRWARAAGAAPRPAAARLAVLVVLGLVADAFFWPVVAQPLLVARIAASAHGFCSDALVVAAGVAPAGHVAAVAAVAAPLLRVLAGVAGTVEVVGRGGLAVAA
jgi:hypothetical protein